MADFEGGDFEGEGGYEETAGELAVKNYRLLLVFIKKYLFSEIKQIVQKSP